jgi:hypothetical protein
VGGKRSDHRKETLTMILLAASLQWCPASMMSGGSDNPLLSWRVQCGHEFSIVVALDPYIGGHALTVTIENLNLSNMTAAIAVISVCDSTDRHHSPSAAPSAALYTYLSFWTSKETYYLLLSTTRGQSFFSPSASLLIIFSRTNCLFPKCRDPVLRNLLVILF